MIKKLEKCLKCQNNCKIETETNAALISCKHFISKRSVAVQKKERQGKYTPD